MNIHVKPPHRSPWADYPIDDVPTEDDPLLADDEPYNRCPFCNAAMAGFVGAVVLGGLMLAAFAIKEGLKWLI